MQSRNSFDGRVLGALVLIGLGVLFFVAQFTGWNLFAWIWPLFIILPGLAMFVPVVNGREAGLAVPASIVTGTGLLLFYQSVTGNWGSWAYAWTLYGVFLGFGLWLTGRMRDDTNTRQTGVWFMAGGAIAFVFFFMLFGGFGALWPLILIAIGVFMLFRAMGGRAPENLDRAIRSTSPAPSTRVMPPSPPEEVEVKLAKRTESLSDRFTNDPLQREIAAALAEDDAPQGEAVPARETAESADAARQLTEDIEAEIAATAAAAEDMIDDAGEEDDES